MLVPCAETATAPRVLVVDDDAQVASALARALKHLGLEVAVADSGQNALTALRASQFDVMVIDLRMPDMDGIDLLRRGSTHSSFPPTILHSAFLDVRTTVEAMRAGATEVMEKPVRAAELAERIHALKAVSKPRRARERSATDADDSAEGTLLLGKSAAMQELRASLRRVARFRDLTVLIEGATGTGKELVAQSIHQLSSPNEPLVSVNCAAIPAELFESELFGHDSGAFTSARAARAGLLEEAGAGTLFLDEVGELPVGLQAKLLRVLETREFRRVGSNRVRRFEARVVSATNRKLGEASGESFRSDLYFRISGHTLRTPALRAHAEDIPELAAHFCRRFCDQNRMGPVAISESAQAALSAYHWPGNARQLRLVVESAVVHTAGRIIEHTQIAQALYQATLSHGPLDSREISRPMSRPLPDLEREVILEAYQRSGQNLTRAAETLGIPRTTLRDRIKRYGVR